MKRLRGAMSTLLVAAAFNATASTAPGTFVGSLGKGSLSIFAPADIGSYVCWEDTPIALEGQRTLYFFGFEIKPTGNKDYDFVLDFNGPMPLAPPELAIGAALLPVFDNSGSILGLPAGVISFQNDDAGSIVSESGVFMHVARDGKISVKVRLEDYVPFNDGLNTYSGSLYVSIGLATIAAVPEPNTSILAMTGIGILLLKHRNKKST